MPVVRMGYRASGLMGGGFFQYGLSFASYLLNATPQKPLLQYRIPLDSMILAGTIRLEHP